MTMTRLILTLTVTGVLILTSLTTTALAQSMLSERKPYVLHSGVHDGQGGDQGNSIRAASRAYEATVNSTKAPWLRLHFDTYELGEQSYILITSLEDGAYQRLDAKSIEHWRGASAFFNGDAVRVELYVAPEDKAIHFELNEIMAGKRTGQPTRGALRKNSQGVVKTSGGTARERTEAPTRGVWPIAWEANDAGDCETSFPFAMACDGVDERVPSTDPAVARGVYQRGIPAVDTVASSTAYLISNGAFLTAGHTVNPADHIPLMYEFDVPASDPDGTANFSHPDDQYPYDAASLVFEEAGVGNDWGVFDVFPNANTGLTAIQAQDAYYRITRDTAPAVNETLRITGYGNDNVPRGSGGNPMDPDSLNAASQTQQTDIGRYLFFSTNFHGVEVDIALNNSGSPCINEASGLAFGINTHGITPDAGGVQLCTGRCQGFTPADVTNAINNFRPNHVYVDNGHPETPLGTVFNPYHTVTDGVNNVPAGGTVSIVEGTYPGTLTINRALTLEVPVGAASIGGGGISTPAKLAGGTVTHTQSSTEAKTIEENPTAFRLSENYPDPFNPLTTITYTLPEAVEVSLVVYDLLGRQVARLVDGYSEAGRHTVRFDASGLSSGVYLYRIQAGVFSDTRPMILVK